MISAADAVYLLERGLLQAAGGITNNRRTEVFAHPTAVLLGLCSLRASQRPTDLACPTAGAVPTLHLAADSTQLFDLI